MATIYKWTPFGVALDITATGGTVTRTSATQYTVAINASWETYYSGAKTNYGMKVVTGGSTRTISAFDGTARSSGSISFTQTFSISGNGASTKTITVAFTNFNTDNGDSATKNVTFAVNVPAWTSCTIKYNANGGTGAPSSQTKWKDQTLVLSSTKPTRTGYAFLGWSTSSSATSATYSAGGNYTANSAATLYAVWKANTYTVSYNANGGTGAPSSQTKTYGVTLTLSSTTPTKTNYNFKGWGTSASSTTVSYVAGASYTNNAAVTLYAIWELAYIKPSIFNINVERFDADGVADDATNVLVGFEWSTYEEATTAVIELVLGDETISSVTNDLSGTSGTISRVLSNISIDHTYIVNIRIEDSSGGSTTISKTLSGFSFPIDILSGDVGTGVAFGKPAEKADTVEVALKTEFQKVINVQQNRYAFSTPGTAGTDGYIKIATFTIIAANADSPITFILSRRGAVSPMTVHVCFTNSNTTSSTLSSITYEGTNYGVFLCQSDTLVWDMYVQKGSAYDTITVQDWWMSKTMDARITVTFSEELVTEIPKSYYRATPTQLRSILDFIYPVGSIYMSYSHNNPAVMFGGTWTRLTGGFLWASQNGDIIGQTGGEKTHTLTVNELPAHTHTVAVANTASGSNTASNMARYNSNASSYIGSVISTSTGGGAAHNNMPPYIQVSIWRRTA